MSNFKSLQSTIQGGSSSFAPFNPQDTAGTPQKDLQIKWWCCSRPTPAVSELQKLQQHQVSDDTAESTSAATITRIADVPKQLDQQLQQKSVK